MSTPLIVQDHLRTVPQRPPSQRIANPNAATPATFRELNWNHSENSCTSPKPEPNVSTLTGPHLQYPFNDDDLKGHIRVLHAAVKLIRKAGFKVVVVAGRDVTEEQEFAELDRWSHDQLEATCRRTGAVKATFAVGTLRDPWLVVRCNDVQTLNVLGETLRVQFLLATIHHDKQTWVHPPLSPPYRVTVSTGGKNEKAESIATEFKLQLGEKVICKALCSYRNAEVDEGGPTVELLETAAEWRGHGFGSTLMEVLEMFYESLFEDVMSDREVRLLICHVTNHHASEWFQNRGYRNDDGMGEELSKALGPGEHDLDEDLYMSDEFD